MTTIWILSGFLACGDKAQDTETETDTDTVVDDGVTQADFIYVSESAVGNQECFIGGYETMGGWNTQTLIDFSEDGSFEAVKNVDVSVIDFETDEPVSEATVEVYYADELSGSPDVQGESDAAGALSLDVPVCSPYSYRVFTDPALDETRITIEAHTIEAPSVTATEFNSVSKGTYQVIPSLLGVAVDPDKGIVAGTMYDCNGDKVLGAQVVVKNAAGEIPESLVVNYFVDDFPNRNQEYTSEDGLWVASNVPVGEWTIEAYVSAGDGSHIMVGATQIQVFANSINISNIHLGFGDGLKYPDDCVTE